MSIQRTDVLIVGAGPVGLFAAFQLGLFGFTCRIIDALGRAGGQCLEYYADKPIYDIPAWSAITGQELIDRLLEQVAPFDPQFSFNTVARSLSTLGDSTYHIELSESGAVQASAVIIAGGWGVIGALVTGDDDNPISNWGVGMVDNVIPVDPSTFQSALPGVFSIGDMCSYPGKLRLILSGFHEAALATQAIRKLANPHARLSAQYTTTSSELRKKLGATEQK